MDEKPEERQADTQKNMEQGKDVGKQIIKWTAIIISVLVLFIIIFSVIMCNQPKIEYGITKTEFGVDADGNLDNKVAVVTVTVKNPKKEKVTIFCSVNVKSKADDRLIGFNSHYIIVQANSTVSSAFVIKPYWSYDTFENCYSSIDNFMIMPEIN